MAKRTFKLSWSVGVNFFWASGTIISFGAFAYKTDKGILKLKKAVDEEAILISKDEVRRDESKQLRGSLNAQRKPQLKRDSCLLVQVYRFHEEKQAPKK